MSKEFLNIAELIDGNNYELNKLNIFNHDTLDEANPKHERTKSDITIEIGGPGTHISFAVRTRAEHTIIKHAVIGILRQREKDLNEMLDVLCQDRLGQNEPAAETKNKT